MKLPKPMLEILERSRKERPYSSVPENLEKFVESVVNVDLFWIRASYDNIGELLGEKHPLYKEIKDSAGALYWLHIFVEDIEGSYKTGRLHLHSLAKDERWVVEAFPELAKNVNSLLTIGSQVRSIQENIEKRMQTLSVPSNQITQQEIDSITQLVTESLRKIAESKQTYEAEFSEISQAYREKFAELYARCQTAVELGLVPPLDETKWRQKPVGRERLENLLGLYREREALARKTAEIDKKIREMSKQTDS